MKLFTPFTIPKKENCDLYRIKNNKRGKQPLFLISAVVSDVMHRLESPTTTKIQD